MTDQDPHLFAPPAGATPPPAPGAGLPAPLPGAGQPATPRPAPPSAHLGWVVAAWILCWPLAIPAHLARRRALAALGRQDAGAAAREAALTRTFGGWAIAVGATCTALVLVGLTAWGSWWLAQEVVRNDLLPVAEDGGSASGDAEPDDSVPVLETVYPGELLVGDCFDSRLVDFEAEEYTFDVVDCAYPHTSEVFAEVTLPESEFPGDRALDVLAGDYCSGELDALGLGRTDEEVYAWWYWPNEEYWTYDTDRIITCIAETVEVDAVMEGPLLEPGVLDEMTSYAALRPGDCFDSDDQQASDASGVLVPVRPCERLHLSEAFAQVPLPSTEYPGDVRKEHLGDEACRAEFERLGLGAGDGTLTVGSISPGRDQWGTSTFDVVTCYLESTETLLQGSVVDGRQV